uniref:ATP synthase complex subunit 8 n=1 Tax=Anthicidae sp. 1 ACP-2013 TaxID=1434426 RepID=A0A3G5FNG7_9CUCU|nr:ATP synthase F0 subunit 8 [Anthicidae sp. 1 ACP-2013]
MPQMAPLNWLMLMVYFILIFMMINSINYYLFTYNHKTSSFKKKTIKMNWKW